MKLIVVVFLCFALCAQAQLPDTKPFKTKFTAAARRYSGEVYEILATSNSGNVIFSPLSIYLTMGMLLAGTRNNTASELRRAMKFRDADLTNDKVHNQMRKLYGNAVRRNPDLLRVANGLFLQEDYSVKPSYLDVLRQNYDAELDYLNFIDAVAAAERINNWVENVTENRIQDLINPLSLGERTRLVLTNALYFKANWQFAFKRTNNYTLFNRSDGSQVNANFIEVIGTFPSTTSDDGKIRFAAIPYKSNKNKNYFVVGVPTEEGATLSSFNNNNPQLFFENLGFNKWSFLGLRIVIPEFEISQDTDVKNQILMHQGVNEIFEPSGDFSGITDQESLYVTEYLHKAFINVNRNGTEAAAASAIIFAGRSGAGPIEVIANQPFFYGIYSVRSEVFSFMGKIEDPSLSES